MSRGNGYYLVNAVNDESQERSSLILYYDDIVDGGNDNQDPQEISERKSGDGGDFLYWENGDQSANLSNGQLNFNIRGDAQSQEDFSPVGTANVNGREFTVYKDRTREFIHRDGETWTVLYYVLAN